MRIIQWLIRLLFLALFVVLFVQGKVMLWLGLYGVSLVLAVIFGRIYCGYVCPMNTVMIPTEWISEKLKIQTDKYPKWLESGHLAWFFLIGSIAAMVLARKFLQKNIPILLIWVGVSILMTLRYKPAVFHNLVCPFGPLQRVFGKFARFSERVVPDKCIGCSKCEKVCPSNAIAVDSSNKKALIETSLCFQCTNCVEVCPTSAIHYSASPK